MGEDARDALAPHPSRYTIAVEGDAGETLLFNTACGAFAALDATCAQAYENGTCDAQLEQRLARAGFLTDATPDEELEALRARFERQRHDHAELALSLVPTYACNYRCPYCYEQDVRERGGHMDARVMDAVLAFVERRYSAHAFERLSVQWYGGDPSLALDVVEELSERMIGFCDERGIDYDALILSNCERINKYAAKMLARVRVSVALLTIDGFADMHRRSRVPADGSDSYADVLAAARLLTRQGIRCSAVMNVDAVNWHEYPELRAFLHDEYGIELEFCRMSDCGHFFGTQPFTHPTFDLLSPAEFAKLQHEQFAAGGADAATLAALLAAPERFCNGQRDDYFIIDCTGNVYACDGYIGHESHVNFSVFDEPSERQLQRISHDPFENAGCSACTLLPLCLGNCNWERETDQMQCHPLKWSLPSYLKTYRACFEQPTAGFTLLYAGT